MSAVLKAPAKMALVQLASGTYLYPTHHVP